MLPLAMLKLPIHLFLTTLALVASALPVASVELLVLTPDNFKSTIAKGVWFVEHFSPYCHHCTAFAPTWEQLVHLTAAKPDPGIHLAQVNCAVNGDLCNDNNIGGYPQMNLYKDGQFIEKYSGARDIDLLTGYLVKHAELDAPLSDPDSTPRHPEPADNPNPNGMVVALDEGLFQTALKDGPVFVKFYAPWCGHCKKLAPVWTQLAAHMRHKLNIAEVNCDEHSALCKSQDVKGYPMLQFYAGGRKTEYNGGRKFEQLKSFAEGTVKPAVSDIKDAEYEQYVRENPVVYLLLHGSADARALNQLQSASQILLGSPPVLASTSPSLRARFTLPSNGPILLAIKDGVINSYTASLTSFEQQDALRAWLTRHRLPTAIELAQETFQSVMNAPDAPLVVLAAAKGDLGATADAMRSLGKAWRAKRVGAHEGGKDVVFSWMDAERWHSWLKSMYGIKGDDLPAVVLIEHDRLVYYDKDVRSHKLSLTAASLFGAIDAALAHKLPYKHSENIIERTARHLNEGMIALEKAVVAHPWRTVLFGIGLIAAFILFVKRFISEDINTYSDQKYLHKAPGRLD